MKRKQAIANLVAAVTALLIAIWFVHMYSQYVWIRLQFEVEAPELTHACAMLLAHSLLTLFLPLLILLAGVIMIVTRMETGMSIVCQSGWVLALALMCFTIVAWEVSFIPASVPLGERSTIVPSSGVETGSRSGKENGTSLIIKKAK